GKKSIVISRSLALGLFKSHEDAVGKSIEWNREKEYVVSGVFEDVPSNSSAKFDFLIPYHLLLEKYPFLKEWGNSDPNTYLVLQRGTDIDDFNKKLSGFLKSKIKSSNNTLFVRPYSEGYLFGHYENGIQAGGRIEYVTLFSMIAVFILFIASINFMNLSTAKASRRIKEVGIKKAIGAHRRTLIVQYLGESMFMSFLSLLIAVLIADLILPQFNDITGKNLSLEYSSPLILVMFSIAALTGLVAGSYPAFYLSGFKPAVVLKGKLHNSVGEQWARNGLVIFQFAITIIFIVSVLVVQQQIHYVQSKNMGYDKDNVLSFSMAGSIENILANREPLLSEIKNMTNVVSASSMDHSSIVADYGTLSGLQWEGSDPDTEIHFQNIGVNYGLIETMNMQIVEGRSFSKELSSDPAEVIFNEAAIQAMGIVDPIGKVVKIWDVDRKIVGIVKNFHVESLHENVKPFLFRLEPEFTNNVIAKIKTGSEQETIDQLQKIFQKFNPGFVFNYRFLDDDFQSQYVAEQRVSILSKYFAGLAILISCLGLFGLAAFTAERRNKEIGIRKVLGSSELGIVFLLSSDFTRIVLYSIVIAVPVSYMITSYWLDSFAFRIQLQWWYFIGSGAMALVIAWLTVGSQAIRAARINPARCLKDE
ncbi:MAG: transporter permease, partial [Marivirga sp.]|nr:transporter permease [Marivirga sp.]